MPAQTATRATGITDTGGTAAWLAARGGSASALALAELRSAEYSYLDAGGQVYLDYAGAGLPAHAQIAAHAQRMSERCFGNPHSENPASAASTALVEQARAAILDHFNASPAEYAVVFTANASAACRLVGEGYQFGPHCRFVLTGDNHNSVNGIREFARAAAAAADYVPFSSAELRIDDDAVTALLPPASRGSGAGLFAFPAQSNFSGVQHDLGWIELAHERGYDVLLDAAAYVPCNRLDLSVLQPDFVPVSWYKVFGYPTGVGCLVARRSALARLGRPWFAGGTVAAASVQGDWYALASDETRFEDGTLSFLHVPDVMFGLSWVNGIGLDVIHERVMSLTGRLLRRLAGLRHGNGRTVVALHGPADVEDRGGTVAFSVLDSRGERIDARAVGRAAAQAGICVRTGCFCNPGAAEAALGLTEADLVTARRSGAVTKQEYEDAAAVSGGAVRASLGLASNADDVDALANMIEQRFCET
jgi:selenocysteine lyase/cysteine desulfurase